MDVDRCDALLARDIERASQLLDRAPRRGYPLARAAWGRRHDRALAVARALLKEARRLERRLRARGMERRPAGLPDPLYRAGLASWGLGLPGPCARLIAGLVYRAGATLACSSRQAAARAVADPDLMDALDALAVRIITADRLQGRTADWTPQPHRAADADST